MKPLVLLVFLFAGAGAACRPASGEAFPTCVSIYLHGYPRFRLYEDIEMFRVHPDGSIEIKGYLSFIDKTFETQLSWGQTHDLISSDKIDEVRMNELHALKWAKKNRREVLGSEDDPGMMGMFQPILDAAADD